MQVFTALLFGTAGPFEAEAEEEAHFLSLDEKVGWALVPKWLDAATACLLTVVMTTEPIEDILLIIATMLIVYLV